jgi:uncharacterized membrane protein YbhN (UPF0104 family)
MPRVGKRLATLGLLSLLLLALLASAPGLRGVTRRLNHVSPLWLLAAVALELGSDLSFVVVFRLFFDRLAGPQARRLAWTEMASGALLPGGGAGGLAIGGWLIHLAGAPTRWIIRRSGGLFFLTTAVNSAAIVIAGLALALGAAGPHDFARASLPAILALAATLPVAALPFIVRSHPRTPRLLRAIAAGVQDAEHTTFRRRPSWRLLGAIGYLAFDIAVLWVALRALGPTPSVPAVILAYNIGYLANALPIPGGIGVLDAGLTGVLVLYGVAPAQAAAGVLVYHAIALWVPGLGGLVAYLRLRPSLVQAGVARPPASSSEQSNPVPEGVTP